MRKRNMRLVVFGFVLIALAVGFFLVMQSIAPQSLDPVEMMRLTGQTVGTVVGVSVALIAIGLIGKKEQSK